MKTTAGALRVNSPTSQKSFFDVCAEELGDKEKNFLDEIVGNKKIRAEMHRILIKNFFKDEESLREQELPVEEEEPEEERAETQRAPPQQSKRSIQVYDTEKNGLAFLLRQSITSPLEESQNLLPSGIFSRSPFCKTSLASPLRKKRAPINDGANVGALPTRLSAWNAVKYWLSKTIESTRKTAAGLLTMLGKNLLRVLIDLGILFLGISLLVAAGLYPNPVNTCFSLFITKFIQFFQLFPK